MKGIGSLKPYLSLLRGQEADIALALVLMLGSTAVALAIPVYAGRLVDVLGGAALLELPALFFTGQKAGDLSTRVTGDVGSIQHLLTTGLVSLTRASLTLAGALVMMLGINPRNHY